MSKKFIIFAIILTLCLGAFVGCKKPQNDYMGWEIVEERLDGVGDSLQYYAIFSISAEDSNRYLDDVWINLFGVKDESVVIALSFANSSSIKNAVERIITVNKTDLESNGGWVKLIENAEDMRYTYVEVMVTQNMTINEFVMVSQTNKKLKLTLSEMGARPKRESNSYKFRYTQTQLEDKIDDGTITSSALNLIDEQDRLTDY